MNTPTYLSSYEECRNALAFLRGYVFNISAGQSVPSQAELYGFDELFSYVLRRLDATMDNSAPQSASEVL